MKKASQAAALAFVTDLPPLSLLSTGVGQWKDSGFRSQILPSPFFWKGTHFQHEPPLKY